MWFSSTNQNVRPPKNAPYLNLLAKNMVAKIVLVKDLVVLLVMQLSINAGVDAFEWFF